MASWSIWSLPSTAMAPPPLLASSHLRRHVLTRWFRPAMYPRQSMSEDCLAGLIAGVAVQVGHIRAEAVRIRAGHVRAADIRAAAAGVAGHTRAAGHTPQAAGEACSWPGRADRRRARRRSGSRERS